MCHHVTTEIGAYVCARGEAIRGAVLPAWLVARQSVVEMLRAMWTYGTYVDYGETIVRKQRNYQHLSATINNLICA